MSQPPIVAIVPDKSRTGGAKADAALLAPSHMAVLFKGFDTTERLCYAAVTDANGTIITDVAATEVYRGGSSLKATIDCSASTLTDYIDAGNSQVRIALFDATFGWMVFADLRAVRLPDIPSEYELPDLDPINPHTYTDSQIDDMFAAINDYEFDITELTARQDELTAATLLTTQKDGEASPLSSTLAEMTTYISDQISGSFATNASVTDAIAAHTLLYGHSDILANTNARHTQGTDQLLDEGGTYEVTAAEALEAYDHSQTTHPTMDATQNMSDVLSILLDAYSEDQPDTAGTLRLNSDGVLELVRPDGGVTQFGEEMLYPPGTYNGTGSDFPNGMPGMVAGRSGSNTLTVPAIADGSIDPTLYIGPTTTVIASGSNGRFARFARVHYIDTVALAETGITLAKGDIVYVSASEAGKYTNVKPASPDRIIVAGLLLEAGEGDGILFAITNYYQTALETSYDNEESELTASNVQSAIDELNLVKAGVDLLSSSITLYPTSAVGDFGYNRMVTDVGDSDYDDPAVDIPTGTITASDQLLAELIADAGLFVGNPGVISIATVGDIAKTAGNSTQYASFYFKVFQRAADTTETLVATSSSTGAVNPADSSYNQFSATAILNNGTWLSTDRVVVRYYATLLGNTGSAYTFRFGGSSPVRTSIPVPVAVIPSDDASEILVDTAEFDGILSGADDDVQTALETIDDHEHAIADLSDVGGDSPLVTGQALVYDATAGYKRFTGSVNELGAPDMNGFPNRTDTTLSMVGSDLTITPTGASFDYWVTGVKYTKTVPVTGSIANDNTVHYVYFTGTNLVVSTTMWSWDSDMAAVAMVYKYGSLYRIWDERHHSKSNRWTHAWAHETIGALWESGYAATFADASMSLAQGVIHDEDLEHDSGGTLTTGTLWYRKSGGAAMVFEEDVAVPYKALAGVLQYDDGGTLTPVGNNKYVNCWVYATNDHDDKITMVVGQAQHVLKTTARNEGPPTIPGIPTREWKLLYRTMYQNNGGTPLWMTDVEDTTDFRMAFTGPNSDYTPSSHTNLTDRDATDSHPATAVSVTATPDNYTAAAAEVESHLAGIDDALSNYILSSLIGAANGIASLDENAQVILSQLPAIALVTVSVVANETEQLALTAQTGDVAVRSDENKSYMHNGGTAGTMADWTLLATPTDVVLSVAGLTGAISAGSLRTAINVEDGAQANTVDSVAGLTGTITVAGLLTAIGVSAGAEPNPDDASDAEVVAGTETATRLVSPAQLKLAAETHGGGGGGTAFPTRETEYTGVDAVYSSGASTDTSANCVWRYDSLYNDEPSYVSQDGSLYLWEDGTGDWYVSATKGTAGTNYFMVTASTPEGSYSGAGSWSGETLVVVFVEPFGVDWDQTGESVRTVGETGAYVAQLISGLRIATGAATLRIRLNVGKTTWSGGTAGELDAIFNIRLLSMTPGSARSWKATEYTLTAVLSEDNADPQSASVDITLSGVLSAGDYVTVQAYRWADNDAADEYGDVVNLFAGEVSLA